jgi:hypothetical protein
MFAIFKRQHAMVVEPGGAAPNNDIAVFQRHAKLCAWRFQKFIGGRVSLNGAKYSITVT